MRLSGFYSALSPVAARFPDADPEISGVTENSSRVRPGFLFCAISGAKADGHRYLADAACGGAAALVVAESYAGPLPDLPAIRVRDCYFAWALVCEAWFGFPGRSLRVHAATGTNGKTSCVCFLRHLLAADSARRIGVVSTVWDDDCASIAPSEHTTPDAFALQSLFSRMRKNGATDAVMECSSHGLSQRRSGGMRFASAIFTNLTGDHLDYHGTMERYFQAKKLLFAEMLADGAPAAVNCDDPYGARLIAELPNARLLPVSFSGRDAFCSLTRLEMRPDRSELSFLLDGDEISLELPLPGAFNAHDFLQAFVVADALGVSRPLLMNAVRTVPHVPGRLQPVPLKCGATAFVDYAHTDDALLRVLTSLRRILPPGGRILTVFGCGGDRDRTKRPRMGAVAAAHSDVLILTSDNPRSEDPMAILRDIESGVPTNVPRMIVPDRAEAIARAVDSARCGDFILVAGKGHEAVQEIRGRRLPFRDLDHLIGR